MVGTLIVIFVSFVVFMLLMKAVYFDPILAIKYERERKLKDDRASTQRFAEEYERVHAEYQQGLVQARKDAHRLIQEIRQQAKASAVQTLAEARTSAQAEMDQRLAELQEWRETTYGQMENERASLTRTIIDKVTDGGKVRTATGS